MLKISQKSHSTDPFLLEKSQRALKTLLARNDLGFMQIPMRDELWREIERVATELRGQCTDLVVVGIGGSGLGPRVVQEIFQTPQSDRRLHFCDNVDALEFKRLFAGLSNLAKTAWVFTSKSGSTIETIVSADYILETYRRQSLPQPVICAVTELRANPLFNWAQKNKASILEIPLDVGGRFSVLTAVGMLPAAFLGLDIQEFRRGAKQALASGPEISDFMAQTLMSFKREEWISLFWFYCSSLKTLGAWLQQLWAESLAKKLDRQAKAAPRASTPMGAVGACDQHSILQQVMEGAPDKFVTFVRVNTAESGPWALETSGFPENQFFVGRQMGELLAAEAEATRKALSQEGVSTLELKLHDLSPATIGYIFMFWELVVGGLGEALDINAFDQPGVELGKRLAKEILKS